MKKSLALAILSSSGDPTDVALAEEVVGRQKFILDFFGTLLVQINFHVLFDEIHYQIGGFLVRLHAGC